MMSASFGQQLARNMVPAAAAVHASIETTITGGPANANANSSVARNRTTGNPPYGYHNTFHLHAMPCLTPLVPPPPYDSATSRPYRVHKNSHDVLPRYKCTLHLESQLGLKSEMASPFMISPSTSSDWHDVRAVLHGTQLRLYRLKSSSYMNAIGKSKPATLGRLIKAYSMQHAEVGIATDVKKTDPVPRSVLGKLVPPSSRAKVFETDPHLFQPVREHIIRLRLETEQFLLAASTQEEMLEWVESLCASIDISMPIDDRSEPRYRSLPRRTRRQREAEGRRSSTELGRRLSNLERRPSLIRQQERIIQRLYPHLAEGNDSQDTDEPESRRRDSRDDNQGDEDNGVHGSDAQDPDAEDLDPEDAMIPSTARAAADPASDNDSAVPGSPNASYFDSVALRRREAAQRSTPSPASLFAQSLQSAYSINSLQSGPASRRASHLSISNADHGIRPKSEFTPQLSPAASLRYRRRCAPVLLATSPRASDVVVAQTFVPNRRLKGSDEDRGVNAQLRRVKVDMRKHRLVPFEIHPPKYDAHNFVNVPKPSIAEVPEPAPAPTAVPARTTSAAPAARPSVSFDNAESERPVFAPHPAVRTSIADDGEETETDDDNWFTPHPAVRPLLTRGPSQSTYLSAASTTTIGTVGTTRTTATSTAAGSVESLAARFSRLHLPGSFDHAPNGAPVFVKKGSKKDTKKDAKKKDMDEIATKKSRRSSWSAKLNFLKAEKEPVKDVKTVSSKRVSFVRQGEEEVASYAALLF